MRILVWLAILALALLGRWERSDAITAAIVPVALLFLVFMSPRALRGAIAAIAAAEAIAWWFGGIGLMIDILPAAIAAFVGWLFARSLVPPRMPLIARAIAAIDGPAHLRDPAVGLAPVHPRCAVPALRGGRDLGAVLAGLAVGAYLRHDSPAARGRRPVLRRILPAFAPAAAGAAAHAAGFPRRARSCLVRPDRELTGLFRTPSTRMAKRRGRCAAFASPACRGIAGIIGA